LHIKEKRKCVKSYQKRSVQSYLRAVRQLQNFTCKAVEDITQEEVREYWLYCKEELGWGSATLRISYSGIKLFYSLTLKRDWEVLRSVKFERDQTLPVVLSIDEVRSILAAIPTLQNRAFFTVMYACGLRLGEAIHLQVRDIDGQRQFIHVRHGKGAKDRLVPLAESALSLLRAYYKTHRNPTWVFPALGKNGQGGPTAEQPVSETTVQGALRRAVVKTGLRKPVRPHTLRHSYATHMIEAGVPVRHVQECLGHESLASTMIYLHITSHGKEDSRRRMNQLMRGVLS
jgi:site-specific recombinase XerD